MRIYIASQYGRRLEMLGYAKVLRAAGHTVTSRWVFGAHDTPIPDEDLSRPEHRVIAGAFALADVADVQKAELFLAFTEPRLPFVGRGGRHWEAGMAYTLGRIVWLCGPRENVFYCLPQVRQFSDFAAVMEALSPAQR